MKRLTAMVLVLALSYSVCFANLAQQVEIKNFKTDLIEHGNFPKAEEDTKIRWFDYVLIVAGLFIVKGSE